MKVIFAGFLLLGIVAAAFADCDHNGKKLKSGEKYAPLGECIEYTCHEGGGLSALGCALSFGPGNCKEIPQDNSKPYPKCCPSFDC